MYQETKNPSSSPGMLPPWTTGRPGHQAGLGQGRRVADAVTRQREALAGVVRDSYGPGGRALTRRLGCLLYLAPDEQVLDVTSGTDMTAFFLVTEFGVRVDSIDLCEAAVMAGNAKARQDGIDDRLRFRRGDPLRLPVASSSVDALVAGRALFPSGNRRLPVSEIARVLRPGGRVGITVVTAQWSFPAHSVPCLTQAQPFDTYLKRVQAAGLQVILTERHDHALATAIKVIDARLTVLRVRKVAAPRGLDVNAFRRELSVAATAVGDGVLGYSLVVARKEGRFRDDAGTRSTARGL